jgi:hypothetical protein
VPFLLCGPYRDFLTSPTTTTRNLLPPTHGSLEWTGGVATWSSEHGGPGTAGLRRSGSNKSHLTKSKSRLTEVKISFKRSQNLV